MNNIEQITYNMKKTILALMLATISIEAHSAFTAYYPLENYKDTGGHLPPGSILFKPAPSVTPPDPVDPVEPVEPEPTEEEKKGDCYNRINEILGNSSFNIDSAVKEYENGDCAVNLNTINSDVSYARYLDEYVGMVITFGNAGIMPSFNYTHNTTYNASGIESYPKQYNIMINAIKNNEIYANIMFTPKSSYRSTYKGYKIYTIITNCESALKKYIDDGFGDYYFGTQTLKGGCEGRWSELFKDVEFIKTTK